MIEELVDEALDSDGASAARPRSSHDLAFPLPFDVISEMLGMPEADKDQVAEWSSAIVKTLDPIITEEEIFAAADAEQEHERVARRGDRVEARATPPTTC